MAIGPIKAEVEKICVGCDQQPELRRILFDSSPIPIWEEDFSEVKKFLDGLKRKGVKDFRDYFKSHPQAVARCSALIKIIDVNKAAQKLYGAKSKEQLFKNLPQIFTPQSYDVFREELIALAQGKKKFQSEAENKTLQGRLIRIDLILWVVPRHEDKLSRVFVFTSDLSRRAAVEEELKREQSWMWLIVERVPCVFWAIDSNFIITRSMGMATKDLGLDPKKMIGQNLRKYLDVQGVDRLPLEMHQAALSGKSVDYEHVYKGRNFKIHIEPIRDVGAVAGAAGFAYDVTDVKLAQEDLRQKNEDLIKMNSALVGREMKMVELKEEMDGLKAKLAELEKGRRK